MFSKVVELILMQQKQGNYEYYLGLFIYISKPLICSKLSEHSAVFENEVRRSAYSYRHFRLHVL